MRNLRPNYIICFIFTFLLFVNNSVFANAIIYVSTVSINKATDTLTLGQTDIIKGTFTPHNTSNRIIKWKSSNTTIVKIDALGKVTPLTAGIVSITGITVDKGLKVSCKIIVKPKPVISVSKVVINKTTDSLKLGQTDVIRATFTPYNTTNRIIKWKSLNTTIAKIDALGKVTALNTGVVTITGITVDKRLKASCRIIIKPLVYIPKLNLLFNLNDSRNFQSLTYFNKYLYCGFDVGGGQGEITKYSMMGTKISENKPINVGHLAGLGYRDKTDNIYISNGGGEAKTHVYVVKYDSSKILKNINYEYLGTSALLAIDSVHDYLILHTILSGRDFGSPKFTIINLANMKVIKTFTEPNQGQPQGLETNGSDIYYYTDNKITTFNYNGKKISTQYINEKGESEGISMILDNNMRHLIIGFTNPNRIYELN